MGPLKNEIIAVKLITVDEYINYVKTLLVHGYTPSQIRALLSEVGVDDRTMQSLSEYMDSTIAQKSTQKNTEHRNLTSIAATATPLPQDYMHTDYVKKNFEYVTQQVAAGKSKQEIATDLTKKGVDGTTSAILLELANRSADPQPERDKSPSVIQYVQAPAPPPEPPEPQTMQRKAVNKLIFFVAAIQPLGVLPQSIAIYRHHNVSGVSITTWVLLMLFEAMWAWYGYLEKQKAVFISGVLFVIFDLSVVIGAIVFSGKT